MLQLSRPVLLVTSFVLALVTALIVRSWVETVRQHAVPSVQTTEANRPPPRLVMVAARDLPAGHFVKPEDVTWQAWPTGSLMSAYVLQGSPTSNKITGSVVRNGIAAGEPMTTERLVHPGDRGFLAAVLAPGYRAITVPITGNIGLSGLVVPGDRVDVVLTTTVPNTDKQGAPRRVSETLLQNIRILALDQKLDDQANQAVTAHTATVEVTPKQVEIVSLIGDMGKVSMSLRSLASPGVDEVNAKPTMTWDTEATGLGPKPTAAVKKVHRKPAGFKVGITRGIADTEVSFPGGAK